MTGANMKRMIALAMAAIGALPFAAVGTTHDATQAAAGRSAAFTDGEVRRVDRETKKITIRHGAIANLDMPPMTMVFQVRDPAMLDAVRAGDKVRFSADKVGGAYTVTELEPLK
jgi:Cu/Ag efflux protein CusF